MTTQTGWAIIFAAFAAGSVLGAWSYARDSSSRFGTASLSADLAG
jgi:hypothetical protein